MRPPGEGVAAVRVGAAGVGAGGDATGATWISLRFRDFSSAQSFGTCFEVSQWQIGQMPLPTNAFFQ
jgi:hypothetical protein